jgi:hypothetical protein
LTATHTGPGTLPAVIRTSLGVVHAPPGAIVGFRLVSGGPPIGPVVGAALGVVEVGVFSLGGGPVSGTLPGVGGPDPACSLPHPAASNATTATTRNRPLMANTSQATTLTVSTHRRRGGPFGGTSGCRATAVTVALPTRTAVTVTYVTPSWSNPNGPTEATVGSELATCCHRLSSTGRIAKTISVPAGAHTWSTGARSGAHTTVTEPATQPSGRTDPVTAGAPVSDGTTGFTAGDRSHPPNIAATITPAATSDQPRDTSHLPAQRPLIAALSRNAHNPPPRTTV